MIEDMSNKTFARLLGIIIVLVASIGLVWVSWPYLGTVARWVGIALVGVVALVVVFLVMRAWQEVAKHQEAIEGAKTTRLLQADEHTKRWDIEELRVKQEHERLMRELDHRAIMDRQRFDLEQHLAMTRVRPGEHGYEALIERGDDGYSIKQIPYAGRVAVSQVANSKQAQPTTVKDTDGNLTTPLRIPSFAESLQHGTIGPDQPDMLFCFQLVENEETNEIQVTPLLGAIGEMHTQFVAGGSQSGKTTYMAGIIAQAAAMGALFYIVDPHKIHPEKSIAAKVAAFSDRFILPPAATHQEIAALLKHATKLRDDRIAGKPTPYDGHPIMVIVDEVPALMMYQRSTDKPTKQLYLDLALFMQSIGTQTAKFGVTGLFGSQFTTKEELGEVEIKDACMSQLILRLHPTQAQAMRILGTKGVDAVKRMPKGHGFLMLSNSYEPVRVASGIVTSDDLALLASMLPPSPLVKVDRNQTRNQTSRSSVIPFPGMVESTIESTLKEDENTSRNQIDAALQAKVARVLELLGENKGDIIYAVWGVRPGKSEAYQNALTEYEQVMKIIQAMAKGA